MADATASKWLMRGFVSLWIVMALGREVPAGELSARDIMSRNFIVSKIAAMKSDSTMLLVNSAGSRRERRMTTILALQKNSLDSNILIKFTYPPDIRGTSFLQIEHSDGEDDLWIYLPALKKSRRLIANNKKDSFMGSDFSYGDILPPRVELYDHHLVRSERVEAGDCFVVESVPIDEAEKRNSGYRKKTTWVRKDNYLTARVEYIDLSGRPLKTQTTSRHELIEPDNHKWLALRREMVNLQTGHRTILSLENIKSGIAIDDNLFNARTIERE